MLCSFSAAHLNCWGLKGRLHNSNLSSLLCNKPGNGYITHVKEGCYRKKHANLVALLLCVVSVEVFGSGLAEEEEDQEGKGEGDG